MIGRPGTTVWLFVHELRLAMRRWNNKRGQGRRRTLALAFMIGVPILLGVAVGIPLGVALDRFDLPVTPVTSMAAAFFLVTTFTLMLSQSMAAAVDALYERNDLDLLFSSPLRPRTVMTVRFLGVAATVFWIFAYFLIGPLAVIAVMGDPQLLAILIVLFGLGLAASGGGLMITAALFRVLGPRRTRTLGQVLAAVIGAAIFLMSQSHQILGRSGSRSAWQQVMALAGDPAFQVPGLDWPLRAMLGQPLPLLAMTALGAGVFLAANAWLGPRFAADAAAAAGAGRGSRRSRRADGAFARGAFAATLAKELRLVARDPALVTQVLLRVLYMLPVGFLLLRQAGEGTDHVLPGGAAVLVFLASQVGGSLAWITVSAEDAPDLIASAPAPASLVRRGKLAAAALPLAVLLAPVLVPLTVVSPLAGVAATLGCAAAMAATGLVNVWWQRPGKRSEFRNRRRASWFVAMADFFVAALIAAATGLVAAGLAPLALAPAAVAALTLWLLRRSDAQIVEAVRAAAT